MCVHVCVCARVCVPVCVCPCVCVPVCVGPCVCVYALACTQSCPTLCDPMDYYYYGLPGSSVHGIFQARILEQVAIYSSRGSS